MTPYIYALLRFLATVAIACVIGLALVSLPTWLMIAAIVVMVAFVVLVEGRAA